MHHKARTIATALVIAVAAQMLLLFLPAEALAATAPTGKNVARDSRYTVQVTDPNSDSAEAEFNYPDDSRDLTDGTWDSTAYWDDAWVGWANQGRRVITLTLPSRTTIDQIRMRFLQDTGAGIYLPGWVLYETSLDGKEWTTVGADYPWAARSERGPLAEWYRAVDVGRDALYVRATVPVDLWVFGSELQVWGEPRLKETSNGWIEKDGERIPLYVAPKGVSFENAVVDQQHVVISLDSTDLTRLGLATLDDTGGGELGLASFAVQLLNILGNARVRMAVDVTVTTRSGGSKTAQILLRDWQKRLSIRQHAGETAVVSGLWYIDYARWQDVIATLQRMGVDVPPDTSAVVQSWDKEHASYDAVASFTVSETGGLELHPILLQGDRLVLHTDDGEKDVSWVLEKYLAADPEFLDRIITGLLDKRGIRLIPPGGN
jgi:hypothetical protein